MISVLRTDDICCAYDIPCGMIYASRRIADGYYIILRRRSNISCVVRRISYRASDISFHLQLLFSVFITHYPPLKGEQKSAQSEKDLQARAQVQSRQPPLGVPEELINSLGCWRQTSLLSLFLPINSPQVLRFIVSLSIYPKSLP